MASQNQGNKRHRFTRNFAIIVGINKYIQSIPLDAAANDAEKLAEILTDEERKQRFDADEWYQVLLLKDEEATEQELTELIENLKKGKIKFPGENQPITIEEESRLLFYFAGHGFLEEQNSLEGNKKLQLLTQDEKYLPEDSLTDALKNLPCKHKLLILDCCFSGAAGQESKQQVAASREPTVSGKELYSEEYELLQDPTFTLMSSGGYRTVPDTKDGKKHSPFAQAFFDALDNGFYDHEVDSNKDNILTIEEIYNYVVGDRNVQREQRPELKFPGKESTLSGRYFFLSPYFSPETLKKIQDIDKPYKGLFAYEEKDEPIFCGRDDLVEELFERIEHKKQNFVVVIGASGSGKSSIIKAGLVPLLKRSSNQKQITCTKQTDEPCEGNKQWKVLEAMRPGESPLSELGRVILPIYYCNEESNWSKDKINEKIKEIREEWQKLETAQLAQKLDEKINNFKKAGRILLFIDQFEELITLSNAEEKERFLSLLAQIIEKNKKICIVITVRSDFEIYFRDSSNSDPSNDGASALSIFSEHWSADTRLVVGEMNSDQLRKAIITPSRRFIDDHSRRLVFESEALVSRLVDDVRGMPGGLALLSFTLGELYEKANRQGNQHRILIKEGDYDDLGGVTGALIKRAKSIYIELGEAWNLEEKKGEFTKNYNGEVYEDELAGKTRQFMMKQLILRMVNIQGGPLSRRPVSKSELKYPEWKSRYLLPTYRMCQVVDRLTQERLIVVDRDKRTEEPYVEPAHDALILYHNQFIDSSDKNGESSYPATKAKEERDWLKEERESLALRDQLNFDVEEWSRRKEQEPSNPIVAFFIKAVDAPIELLGVKFEIVRKIRHAMPFLGVLILKLCLLVLGIQLILFGVFAVTLPGQDVSFGSFLWLLFALHLTIAGFTICLLLPPWKPARKLAFMMLPLAILGPASVLWYLSKYLYNRLALKRTASAETKQEPTPERHNEKRAKRNRSFKQSSRLWDKNFRLGQAKPLLYKRDSWLNMSETNFIRQSAIQEKKNEFKRSLLSAVVLLVAGLWMLVIYATQRQAQIRKAVAFRESAEASLQSNNALDAAVDILRSQKTLQSFRRKPQMEVTEVQRTLHKVFYAAREHNRLQNQKRIYDVALDSDSDLLAVTRGDGTIVMYKVLGRKNPIFSNMPNLLSNLPNELPFADWLIDVSLDEPEQLIQFSTEQPSIATSVAFWKPAKDTEYLVAGFADSTVKLWKITRKDDKVEVEEANPFPDGKFHNPNRPKENLTNRGAVYSMASDLENKKLAIGYEYGIVEILESVSEEPKQLKIEEETNSPTKSLPFYRMALSSNGKLAIRSEKGEHIEIYDIGQDRFGSKKSLPGHSDVYSVAFAQDGMLMVDKNGKISAINLKNEELVPLDDSDQDTRYRMVSGRDGKLVTLGTDSRVKLWNINSSRLWNRSEKRLDPLQTVQLPELSVQVNDIASSPDGKNVATGSEDGEVRVWDTSGQLQFHRVMVPHPIDHLAILNREDRTLVAAVVDRNVILRYDDSFYLDPLAQNTDLNEEDIYSIEFTSDGKLVTGGADGRVRFWKIKNDGERLKLTEDNLSEGNALEDKREDGTVLDITFSPDGKQIATLYESEDGTEDKLVVRNLSNPSGEVKEIDLPPGSAERGDIVFRTGNQVAFISDDDQVQFLDISKGVLMSSLATQHDHLRSLTFIRGGDQLATLGGDGLVKLWNLSGNRPVEFRPDEELSLESAVLSPEGDRLATIGAEGAVELWKIEEDKLVLLEKLPSETTSVVFSPKGDRLATIRAEGAVELWKIEEDKLVPLLKSPSSDDPQLAAVKATDVVFSPRGDRLATIRAEGAVELWKIEEDKLVPSSENPNGSQLAAVKVADVAFSSENNFLATIEAKTSNEAMRLWPMEGTEETQNSQPVITGQEEFTSVAFMPKRDDEELIATAAKDGTLGLVDTSGKLYDQINTQQGEIKSLIFSSDGAHLATLGRDNSLKIWYIADNQLHPLKVERKEILSVAFNDDGSQLITVDSKGEINKWLLSEAALKDELCDVVKNYLTYSADLDSSDRDLCNER